MSKKIILFMGLITFSITNTIGINNPINFRETLLIGSEEFCSLTIKQDPNGYCIDNEVIIEVKSNGVKVSSFKYSLFSTIENDYIIENVTTSGAISIPESGSYFIDVYYGSCMIGDALYVSSPSQVSTTISTSLVDNSTENNLSQRVSFNKEQGLNYSIYQGRISDKGNAVWISNLTNDYFDITEEGYYYLKGIWEHACGDGEVYSTEIHVLNNFVTYDIDVTDVCGNNDNGAINIYFGGKEYNNFKLFKSNVANPLQTYNEESKVVGHEFSNLAEGNYYIVIDDPDVGERQTEIITVGKETLQTYSLIVNESENRTHICEGEKMTFTATKSSSFNTKTNYTWLITDTRSGVVIKEKTNQSSTYSDIFEESGFYRVSVSVQYNGSNSCVPLDISGSSEKIEVHENINLPTTLPSPTIIENSVDCNSIATLTFSTLNHDVSYSLYKDNIEGQPLHTIIGNNQDKTMIVSEDGDYWLKASWDNNCSSGESITEKIRIERIKPVIPHIKNPDYITKCGNLLPSVPVIIENPIKGITYKLLKGGQLLQQKKHTIGNTLEFTNLEIGDDYQIIATNLCEILYDKTVTFKVREKRDLSLVTIDKSEVCSLRNETLTFTIPYAKDYENGIRIYLNDQEFTVVPFSLFVPNANGIDYSVTIYDAQPGLYRLSKSSLYLSCGGSDVEFSIDGIEPLTPTVTGITSSYVIDSEEMYDFEISPTYSNSTSIHEWYLLTDEQIFDVENKHLFNQISTSGKLTSSIITSNLEVGKTNKLVLFIDRFEACSQAIFIECNLTINPFIDYGIFHIRDQNNLPLPTGEWKYQNLNFDDESIENVLDKDGLYACTRDGRLRFVYIWTPPSSKLFEVATNDGCENGGYFNGINSVEYQDLEMTSYPSGRIVKVKINNITQSNYTLETNNQIFTKNGNIVLENTKKGDSYSYNSMVQLSLNLHGLNTDISTSFIDGLSSTFSNSSLIFLWENTSYQKPYSIQVLHISENTQTFRSIKSKISKISLVNKLKEIIETPSTSQAKILNDPLERIEALTYSVNTTNQGIYIITISTDKPYNNEGFTQSFVLEKNGDHTQVICIDKEIGNNTPTILTHDFQFNFRETSTFQ
ncbi:hypothetical protein MY04_5278 [Flammeovirga sp. MY04]|uniref:hypothetical protein n=1 Tax=Flammeovirga sp. MY04 TaxID=1191459 RepID=UPI000826C413|nr:hypothetical protein [Flammeovirga sp. MY04]ANQ52610.2 hypothetical protein MY04_5278 [Flammeovirga sp. MY04]